MPMPFAIWSRAFNPMRLSIPPPIPLSIVQRQTFLPHLPSTLQLFTILPTQHVRFMPDLSTYRLITFSTGQAKHPTANMTTPIHKAYTAAPKPLENYSRLPLILKARLSVPLGYLANTVTILLKPCCVWQKNETVFPLSTIKSDARPMRGIWRKPSLHFCNTYHLPEESTTSAATNRLLGMNSAKLSFKRH